MMLRASRDTARACPQRRFCIVENSPDHTIGASRFRRESSCPMAMNRLDFDPRLSQDDSPMQALGKQILHARTPLDITRIRACDSCLRSYPSHDFGPRVLAPAGLPSRSQTRYPASAWHLLPVPVNVSAPVCFCPRLLLESSARIPFSHTKTRLATRPNLVFPHSKPSRSPSHRNPKISLGCVGEHTCGPPLENLARA